VNIFLTPASAKTSAIRPETNRRRRIARSKTYECGETRIGESAKAAERASIGGAQGSRRPSARSSSVDGHADLDLGELG